MRFHFASSMCCSVTAADVMRLPQLWLLMGPPKAGSTWLHDYFSAHPEVRTARSKETFFFSDPAVHARGVPWYLDQFQATSHAQSPLFDACHEYLVDPRSAPHLATWPGRIGFLFSFRDPVARMQSAYSFMVYQGRISPASSLRGATVDFPELIDHGDYVTHVRRALDARPDAEVAAVFFESFFGDIESAIDAVSVTVTGSPNPLGSWTGSRLERRSPRSPLMNRAGRALLGSLRQRGFHEAASRVKNSELIGRLSSSRRPPPLPTVPDGLARELYERNAGLLQVLEGAGVLGLTAAPRWARQNE